MTSPMNVAQKLIYSHLVSGEMKAGQEIGIRIDQTLQQDATGTLVMLELEGMGLKSTQAEVSVQYVDHNLLQGDYKNADDHLFLQSSAQHFGIWFSRPGNGVSHPLHMQYFGKPGKTLLGSDSHTPAGGSLGMLAIGAGGLDVALAVAGEPFYVKMPKVFRVNLVGQLPEWVSAKDVILEMLRRHTVKGGVGYILEYTGLGLAHLTAMDRHVIANMGAELGATSTVFPSDEVTKYYLTSQGREQDWIPLSADLGATYDREDEINLSTLEPLIAKPSSPDKVVKVRDIAGEPIYQSYVGSSANPGFRDFAIAAEMVKGRTVYPGVSLDITPSSRNILEELIQAGYLTSLTHAGARTHESGCGGCIGMGQAPATGRNSLRTTPRNFEGRSGTPEDSVFLCSPETAAASALTGKITDPRDWAKENQIAYPNITLPFPRIVNPGIMQAPLPAEKAALVPLIKGPNIASLPVLEPFPDSFRLPIELKTGNNVSTDDISPAGATVLPYRSNIPKISEFCFYLSDPDYASRSLKTREVGHIIIGGENYGQGSSREHAALAPRYLGLRIIITKSFARIHWQNLANFGILALTFINPSDYDQLAEKDILVFKNLHQALRQGNQLTALVENKHLTLTLNHNLSERQIDVLMVGGLINWMKTYLAKKH